LIDRQSERAETKRSREREEGRNVLSNAFSIKEEEAIRERKVIQSRATPLTWIKEIVPLQSLLFFNFDPFFRFLTMY